jgi:hypothetical protein
MEPWTFFYCAGFLSATGFLLESYSIFPFEVGVILLRAGWATPPGGDPFTDLDMTWFGSFKPREPWDP